MAALAIVGARGVLGTKLLEQALAATDAPIFAFTHGAPPHPPAAASQRVVWLQLDIGDSAAVASAFERARPDVVINSAAMTNVDACELDRDAAWAPNAIGPRFLADAGVS